MIATQPQSESFWSRHGFAARETFADDRHLIIYGQRTEDGRIAFGGRGAPYHFGSSVEPRFDHSARVTALLFETLREFFPDLDGGVDYSWGGPLGMSRDLMPSVWVDYESGLAAAGGYTGDGVVLSYLSGTILAQLLTTPSTPTADTTLPFVQRRSRHWEPEPLRFAGINAGLALASWADRSESRRGKESRASGLLDRLFDQFPP
jgi:glycine/D-amino acid oxidase-like deaminating enzyme